MLVYRPALLPCKLTLLMFFNSNVDWEEKSGQTTGNSSSKAFEFTAVVNSASDLTLKHPETDWLTVMQCTGLCVHLSLSLCACVCCVDDSDDDRDVSRKRTVRQAASKAVSKQREILLGDGGSEDEQEDPEESYLDRMCTQRHTHTHLFSMLSVSLMIDDRTQFLYR